MVVKNNYFWLKPESLIGFIGDIENHIIDWEFLITFSLISILGGGDTLAAIKQSKNKLFFTHLSTAGGAFLEYLEGKDLPGLSVLK